MHETPHYSGTLAQPRLSWEVCGGQRLRTSSFGALSDPVFLHTHAQVYKWGHTGHGVASGMMHG
jgi:hypothetical protein